MKLKFKVQPYQTSAVESVVDCFAGQPLVSGAIYRSDPKNADIRLSDLQVLANIEEVQRRQGLPISEKLLSSAGCRFNLDVEMETGTGKTYCYIKTVFEMNKRYGWSKFIVMVPSIAIREGVRKSFQITADHFSESYGRKARFFIFSSKRLHELETFASDAGINVMVINIQAFNARGADNRRIYDELDDFQSRKPIDVIAGTRPILILDEPQKMEGKATMAALPKFKPLLILRYSATHRSEHNKVHRLDALDAYNQKLVKKIAVRGIATRGLAGTTAYLYLEGIEISKTAPVARIELEMKLKSGEIKRVLRRLRFRDDLFVKSGRLDQYRGFTISQIDCNEDTVEFTNGVVLKAGVATGDVSERDIRRIQIRETVKAHLETERQLFAQGIKVLSLFFIDEVVKYRNYGEADEKGEYARIFEEQYELLKAEYLSELAIDNEAYRKYLTGIGADRTHNGYFSIDKRTNRLKDPVVGARAVDSDDVDAYDLILRDKERLLSFEEPTRFIFSHSALREGWDNPNVFVMCMLKHSDNTISRRQEVGRGLRLCVDQHGDRMDDPAVVHDINVLTVVASESYREFVAGLQREISDSLSSRPRLATEAYVADGRRSCKNPLGDSLKKLQERWAGINRRTVCRVELDSDELIRNCIHVLDSQLRVTRLQYTVSAGTQLEALTDDQLREGAGFACSQQAAHHADGVTSLAKYDLLGRIAANTELTRRTAAAILAGIGPRVFDRFKQNPERFIAEASRLIAEQMAAMIVERLDSDGTAGEYEAATCPERVDGLAG